MTGPRRRPATPTAPAVILAMTLAVVAACVPPPVGRVSAGPGTSGAPPPAATATPTALPTGPTPPPSFVRPTPTPLPTFLSYVVRSGDTLTSIARAHGTTARSLAFWNRVRYPSLDPDAASYDPNRIEVGWVLLLVPDTEIDEDSTFPE
jgi:nucleoid-associated protein YgaU